MSCGINVITVCAIVISAHCTGKGNADYVGVTVMFHGKGNKLSH